MSAAERLSMRWRSITPRVPTVPIGTRAPTSASAHWYLPAPTEGVGIKARRSARPSVNAICTALQVSAALPSDTNAIVLPVRHLGGRYNLQIVRGSSSSADDPVSRPLEGDETLGRRMGPVRRVSCALSTTRQGWRPTLHHFRSSSCNAPRAFCRQSRASSSERRP
jgi:hypothetical protein